MLISRDGKNCLDRPVRTYEQALKEVTHGHVCGCECLPCAELDSIKADRDEATRIAGLAIG